MRLRHVGRASDVVVVRVPRSSPTDALRAMAWTEVDRSRHRWWLRYQLACLDAAHEAMLDVPRPGRAPRDQWKRRAKPRFGVADLAAQILAACTTPEEVIERAFATPGVRPDVVLSLVRGHEKGEMNAASLRARVEVEFRRAYRSVGLRDLL